MVSFDFFFQFLKGADRNSQNSKKIAQDCIRQLDSSNDGRVSKGKNS